MAQRAKGRSMVEYINAIFEDECGDEIEIEVRDNPEAKRAVIDNYPELRFQFFEDKSGQPLITVDIS